jgi:hypothetical protein
VEKDSHLRSHRSGRQWRRRVAIRHFRHVGLVVGDDSLQLLDFMTANFVQLEVNVRLASKAGRILMEIGLDFELCFEGITAFFLFNGKTAYFRSKRKTAYLSSKRKTASFSSK